jgi:multidrug efflux pump subunit AcrA (membrane-fusion protein)
MIPRAALRENNVVWVVDQNGQLTFRKISVARLTPDAVLVDGGLKNGEMVVVSSLKAVTDGMRVRLRQEQEGNAS